MITNGKPIDARYFAIRTPDIKYQKKLIQLFGGLGYNTSGFKEYKEHCKFFLFTRDKGYVTGDNREDYAKYIYEDFEEWYFEESIEEKVVLNKELTAVVSAETITVGCQSFPLSVLDDLINAREKVNRK